MISMMWKTEVPGKKELPIGIQCWIGDRATDPEDFTFGIGDIYTDGSAVGVGWDEVEECGAAAVQVQGARSE